MKISAMTHPSAHMTDAHQLLRVAEGPHGRRAPEVTEGAAGVDEDVVELDALVDGPGAVHLLHGAKERRAA